MSAPVIGGSLYTLGLLPDGHPRGLAHHAHDDGAAEAAAQEIISQPRRQTLGSAATERRQTASSQLPRARERRVGVDIAKRRVDEGRGYATRTELRSQARDTVAAWRACGHPVTGVAGVVEVAACHEVGDDLVGNVRWSASTAEPRGQLRAAPRPARQQVARREAGGLGIENFA
jgi:hypothetical protein